MPGRPLTEHEALAEAVTFLELLTKAPVPDDSSAQADHLLAQDLVLLDLQADPAVFKAFTPGDVERAVGAVLGSVRPYRTALFIAPDPHTGPSGLRHAVALVVLPVRLAEVLPERFTAWVRPGGALYLVRRPLPEPATTRPEPEDRP